MSKLATLLIASVALSGLLQPISGSAITHVRALKQGAGVGAGCESVAKQADNGSGYTVEDTENALAGDLGAAHAGKKLLSYFGLHSHRRALKQGAGVGAGCNSVLTQADNGVGYTVEDTENALAGDLGGKPGVAGAGTGRKLSQLDKISDGADNVISAAGLPQQGKAVKTVGDDYDGQGTNDAAVTGQEIGQAEASLPEATQAIPGRKMLAISTGRSLSQTDKIADGADKVLTAAGLAQQGKAVKTVGDDYDGQTTTDAAVLGQEIGQAEASLPEVTQAIPGRKMLETEITAQ